MGKWIRLETMLSKSQTDKYSMLSLIYGSWVLWKHKSMHTHMYMYTSHTDTHTHEMKMEAKLGKQKQNSKAGFISKVSSLLWPQSHNVGDHEHTVPCPLCTSPSLLLITGIRLATYILAHPWKTNEVLRFIAWSWMPDCGKDSTLNHGHVP